MGNSIKAVQSIIEPPFYHYFYSFTLLFSLSSPMFLVFP